MEEAPIKENMTKIEELKQIAAGFVEFLQQK